jgi:hypothetical protein
MAAPGLTKSRRFPRREVDLLGHINRNASVDVAQSVLGGLRLISWLRLVSFR